MSRAERVAARREFLKDVAEVVGSTLSDIQDTSVEKTEIRQEGRSDRAESKAAGGYYTPESTSARWDGISTAIEAGVDIGAMIATGGASGAIPDFSFGGSEEDGSFGVDDILGMIPSDSGSSSSSGTNATATQGGERRSDSSSLGLLAALGAGLLLLK